ncbi:MAG TPA: YigZ family protein [Clostridiaceae bacterium]|nr:YigZ family protein [Clostridiaceae bacterium]
MSSDFRSIKKYAEIEFEEKRSRFIGIAKPLENPAEAEEFIAEQRSRFPDATHHVYAWILNKPQHLQRYSDDGEPQGTAGLPVLDVLQKQNLVQAGIVVIRYFGGVKLGAGGLVRAYSKSASLAIETAEPIIWLTHRMYKLRCDYSNAERVRFQLNQLKYNQTDPEYTVDVSWEVAVRPENEESFIILLKDLTSDNINYQRGKLQLFPSAISKD